MARNRRLRHSAEAVTGVSVWNKDGILWTPAATTQAVWIDFSDEDTVTLSGTEITGMADKSGNAFHMVKLGAGTIAYNTHTQNGLKAARFSSTTVALGTQVEVGTSANRTFFCVAARETSNASLYRYLATVCASTTNADSTTLGAGFVQGATGNLQYWLINETFTFSSGFYTNVADSQAAYTAFAYDTSVHTFYTTIGTANELRVDSISKTKRYSTEADCPVDPGYLTISRNSTNSWQGTYCEFVYIDGLVTSAERQKYEGYFAHKWGLTTQLPSGHPYRDLPPYI